MAKVFISYSRKDIEFAKRLSAELQKCELDFWIDWEGIPPTVDWWKEIEKGIEEADVFLFLISPDSAKSKICGQEIDTAVKNGKRIIPIVVREIEWADTPPQLGHLNYIFFSRDDDFDTATRKLINAIQTDYEWAATHRRLQVKALEWERKNKENSFLLRGKDLQDAELQLATNTSKEPHPTDLQREYVFASRKAADRQRRITTGISIAAAIALAGLAVFGLYQANAATKAQSTAEANLVVAQTAQVEADNNAATAIANEQEAERQATISRANSLSALALSEKDTHYDLAILLSIEGYNTLKNDRTTGTLFTLTDLHPGLDRFLSAQNGSISSIDFSPNGKFLASGSWDNTVVIWNAETYQPIGEPLHGHTNKVTSVVFSPNNQFLVSGSWDKTLRLWDVETHSSIGQPLTGHTESVTSLAFSANGKYLVSGSEDSTFILWEFSDPAAPTQVLQLSGNGHLVTSVAIDPTGDLLATGSSDEGVTLWDISDPQNPNAIQRFPVFGAVSSVAFSPTGDYLAAGSLYYNINVWDVHTYETIATFDQGHGSSVLSIAFSPSGDKLASGSDDNAIYLWDLQNPGNPTRQSLLGSSSGITSLKFSPDGTHLVSGTYENTIILWDLIDKTVTSRLASMNGHYTPLSSVQFSPNGEYLASGGYSDTSVILWDAENYHQDGNNLLGHDGAVMTIDFSPDGKLLASGSYGPNDPSFIVWDVASHAQLGAVSIPHPVYSVSFSPDGKYVAVSGESDVLTLWNITTPESPQHVVDLAGHGMRTGKLRVGISTVAFSPNGRILASGGSDKTIILWDISNPASPSQIATLSGHEDTVLSIAFNPDGTLLISGGDDNNLIVWNLTTYEKIVTLKGHHKAVTSVAFSSDGKILASGSRDNTAILWDISDLDAPYKLATLSDSEWINGVSISADGKKLAAGGDSQVVVVWDIEPASAIEKLCERVGRNFTQSEWQLYFPNKQYPSNQAEATCPQWPLEGEAASLAFASDTDVESVAATEVPVVSEPLAATEAAVATEEPIATEASSANSDTAFIEEFDASMDSWSSFMTSGVDKQVDSVLENGRLMVQLSPFEDKIPRMYWFNETTTYTDVQVEATMTNNGNNANGVSLICQSNDFGWYEFTVSNAGLYSIYAFDVHLFADERYILLATGGSSAIKTGQVTNTYTAVCRGDELSLYVNGTLVKTLVDRILHFKEGTVGFGASSPQRLPVEIQFESVSVSAPE